jgi:hypothetical protein
MFAPDNSLFFGRSRPGNSAGSTAHNRRFTTCTGFCREAKPAPDLPRMRWGSTQAALLHPMTASSYAPRLGIPAVQRSQDHVGYWQSVRMPLSSAASATVDWLNVHRPRGSRALASGHHPALREQLRRGHVSVLRDRGRSKVHIVWDGVRRGERSTRLERNARYPLHQDERRRQYRAIRPLVRVPRPGLVFKRTTMPMDLLWI